MRNQPVPLRRDREAGVLGGVCAGLGSRLGIDPLIMRLVFVAGTAAWGLGLVVYMLCWALIPAEGGARWSAPRVPGSRESWQVASGIGLLMLSLLLLFREWGFWIGDALVWPVVLAAAGGALLWRELTSTSQPAPPAAPGRRAPLAGGTSTIGRAALGAALILSLIHI